MTQSTSGSATVQGPESNGHPALGVADPARTPPDPAHEVATDVSQLLAGFGQGGSGGGTTAADLVAQLSQSGASAQMLLDAISALPQVKCTLNIFGKASLNLLGVKIQMLHIQLQILQKIALKKLATANVDHNL